MFRKFAAATAVAVGITLAATAAPVQAHPGCGANLICFFNEQSNTSPIQVFSGNIARNTCLDDVPDNLTSFIDNNTGVRWKVMVENDCGGVPGPILPNSEGQMNSTWNNVIKATVRTSMTTLAEGPLEPGVF